MLQIPHWEGDAIFLDLIARDVPFFSLKVCYQGDKLVRAVLNGETIPTGTPAAPPSNTVERSSDSHEA